MADFNWVDYIFLGIFLVSILAGFSRGGAKEIVSLLTLIAAIFVASMFCKPLANYFSSNPQVQSVMASASQAQIMGVSAAKPISLLAIGGSFVVLFIGVTLIGTLLGYFVTTVVSSTGLGIVNRLIGGLLGFGRGYIVNLVIIFLVQLTSLAEQPAWGQSRLVSGYQPAVVWLGNLIQPGLNSLKSSVGQTFDNLNTDIHGVAGSIYQGGGH